MWPSTSTARGHLSDVGQRRWAHALITLPSAEHGTADRGRSLDLDRNVITASGAASLEFAYEILSLLGLYSAEVLEAWYGLFKTGHPAYYSALLRAGGASGR